MATTVKEIAVKIGVITRGYENKMKKVASTFKRTADQMDKIAGKINAAGGTLTAKISAPLAAIGTIATVAFVKYERGMNLAIAKTKATGKEIDAMKKKAKELGITTAFSAGDAANALANLAARGLSASQATAVLGDTLNLAASGGIEMTEAAVIMSGSLNSMKLKTKDVAHLVDVLAKASVSSGADIRDLGFALSKVGATAKNMKVPLETVTAAIGVLRSANIDAGTAGTSLRNIFTRLGKSGGKTGKIFKKYKINLKDARKEMKPFADIVDELNTKLGHLAGPERQNILADLVGDRAAAQLAILLNEGGAAIRDFEGKLQGAEGTAKALADALLKGLGGNLLKLKSAAEGAALAFIDSVKPAMISVTKALTKMFVNMSKIDDNMKRVIVAVGVLVGVIGPLLLFFGTMIQLLGLAVAGYGKLFVVMGKTAGVVKKISMGFANSSKQLTFMNSGLVRAIALYQRLAASMQLVTMANMSASFSGMGKAVAGLSAKMLFLGIKVLAIAAVFLLVVNAILTVARHFQAMKDVVRAFAEETLSNIARWGKLVQDWFEDAIGRSLRDLGKDFIDFGKLIGSWAKDAFKSIVTFAKNSIKWLGGKMVEGLNMVIDAMNSLLPASLQLNRVNFDKLLDEMEALADKGMKALDDLGKGVKDGFKEVKRRVVDTATFISESNPFETFMNESKMNIQTVADFMQSTFANMSLPDFGALFGGAPAGGGGAPSSGGGGAAPSAGGGGGGGFAETFAAGIDAAKLKIAEMQEANAVVVDAITEKWLGFGISVNGVMATVQEGMRGMWQTFSDGVGTALANTLIFGKNLKQQMQSLFKQLAAMVIQMLVKIGLQQVATAIVGATAQKVSTQSQIQSAAALAFSNAFASWSGAPWPVSALAPAAAASAYSGALAGGSLLGSAETGGIISAHGFVEVGEKGKKEAIIPLEGAEAKGLGGGPQTIIVELDAQPIIETVVEGMPEHVRVSTGATFNN